MDFPAGPPSQASRAPRLPSLGLQEGCPAGERPWALKQRSLACCAHADPRPAGQVWRRWASGRARPPAAIPVPAGASAWAARAHRALLSSLPRRRQLLILTFLMLRPPIGPEPFPRVEPSSLLCGHMDLTALARLSSGCCPVPDPTSSPPVASAAPFGGLLVLPGLARGSTSPQRPGVRSEHWACVLQLGSAPPHGPCVPLGRA